MKSFQIRPWDRTVRFGADLTWATSTGQLSIAANASRAAPSPGQRMQIIPL
jgi:hypothetical protein